ncbi:hypothetical protein TBLA_0B08610 [Henningerozyma blattae CBS 6284]|uniref:Uncharacterized protein n=1 Tax=Henningerozyma blattae (strain ATCC 34711 / CBS 6284 / DSM 70876 / NBRC 10599 / NRRL Y-10934 / UCD 77-7) TaxID=1071380 RepID=I2GZX4_HENB6|nr:hypothetical protein TBLA_0B08610 [Tetrapisispora blattae CBS 6284]CCH59676.1 hypothetical protein TBLA_0B08610 [Tetrapisispora blattae CBS 6284]
MTIVDKESTKLKRYSINIPASLALNPSPLRQDTLVNQNVDSSSSNENLNLNLNLNDSQTTTRCSSKRHSLIRYSLRSNLNSKSTPDLHYGDLINQRRLSSPNRKSFNLIPSPIYRVPTQNNDQFLNPLDFNASSNSIENAAIVKLLLIGDAGIGKTAMIMSYFDEFMTRSQYKLLIDSKDNNLENSILRKKKRKRRKMKNKDLPTEHQLKRYSLTDYEELFKNSRPNSINTNDELINNSNSNNFYLETSSLIDYNDDKNINDLQVLDSDFEFNNSNDEINTSTISMISPLDDLSQYLNHSNQNEDLIIDTRSTIGVDIKSELINLDNKYFKCILWDTAGQERYRNAMFPSLYKNTNGVFLTYDLTDYASFKGSYEHWLPDALQHISTDDLKHTRFYFVGNKLDLTVSTKKKNNSDRRKVHQEDILNAIDFIKKKYELTIAGYFEVTCKIPHIVRNTFTDIIRDLIENSCFEDNSTAIDTDSSAPDLILNSKMYDLERSYSNESPSSSSSESDKEADSTLNLYTESSFESSQIDISKEANLLRQNSMNTNEDFKLNKTNVKERRKNTKLKRNKSKKSNKAKYKSRNNNKSKQNIDLTKPKIIPNEHYFISIFKVAANCCF